jgi:hypothetical protein
MTDGGGHGLTRVQTVVETLSNQFVASIGRVAIPLCEMADRLESAEPVPDYDPMLVERGHHPPMSRGLSYGFVGLGKDGARMITMDWVFADALRFLAKPGRKNHSISRMAMELLEVWHATAPALGDIFHGSDISVFEFVEALKGAVRGEFAAGRRETEIAVALTPSPGGA